MTTTPYTTTPDPDLNKMLIPFRVTFSLPQQGGGTYDEATENINDLDAISDDTQYEAVLDAGRLLAQQEQKLNHNHFKVTPPQKCKLIPTQKIVQNLNEDHCEALYYI
jgi:hypothetical protein